MPPTPEGSRGHARTGTDGQWQALEANAIGAWGWLAEECGLPIAAAIADELTKE